MKMIFLFFFCLSSLAGIRLESPKKTQAMVGQILKVKMSIGIDDFQKIPMGKIEKLYFGDQFVLLSASSFINDNSGLTSQVEVVFLKDVKSSDFKLSDEKMGEFNIQIVNLTVLPLEAPKDFSYVDIKLKPEATYTLLLMLICFILLFPFVLRFFRKYRQKKNEREKKLKLLDEVIKANTIAEYEKIILLRHQLFESFPDLKESFEVFKKVLDRYQYQQKVSEVQLAEIRESHGLLCHRLMELKRGI